MRVAVVASFCAVLLAGRVARAQVPWNVGAKISKESPSILALRGGYEHTTADDAMGVSLALWSATYDRDSRYVAHARLGYSAPGIDGALAGDYAFGGRLDPGGNTNGFIVRGGVRGHYFGTERFVFSWLSFPRAQLGYQIKIDDRDLPILFEIAGSAGVSLLGRFNVDDTRRVLRPSAEGGGHAALGIGPFRIEGSYALVAPHGPPRTPIHVVDGATCVHVAPVGICADVRSFRGEALDPSLAPKSVSVIQAGLLFGFWLND
ncbi:MAG: hypothetical protein KF819_07390 [Labilithrix sp.]|nr:hypothetical protein [Labilithrix sp.]